MVQARIAYSNFASIRVTGYRTRAIRFAGLLRCVHARVHVLLCRRTGELPPMIRDTFGAPTSQP